MSSVHNDPHRIGHNNGARYIITLSCGHTLTARDHPWNHLARYGCRQGLGCGYRLLWTSFRKEGSAERWNNKGVDNTPGS